MHFNRYIAAGKFEPLVRFLRSEGEILQFGKREFFASQGVRNGCGGLVEVGAFRYVHVSDAGERHIVGYAFAGEFVGDYISMRSGIPSWVSIEAMCDSRIVAVTGDRLEAFYRIDPDHERLGRTLAESMAAEVYERLLQSYTATPQMQYEALLRRCPGLLNLIPLQELASYLRVRPETLSRIRRRVR